MLWNGNPRTKSVNYKEINYTRTAVSRTLKKRIGSEYLLTETEKYDVWSENEALYNYPYSFFLFGKEENIIETICQAWTSTSLASALYEK